MTWQRPPNERAWDRILTNDFYHPKRQQDNTTTAYLSYVDTRPTHRAKNRRASIYECPASKHQMETLRGIFHKPTPQEQVLSPLLSFSRACKLTHSFKNGKPPSGARNVFWTGKYRRSKNRKTSPVKWCSSSRKRDPRMWAVRGFWQRSWSGRRNSGRGCIRAKPL